MTIMMVMMMMLLQLTMVVMMMMKMDTSSWSSSVKGANVARGSRERQTGATQAFRPVTALKNYHD